MKLSDFLTGLTGDGGRQADAGTRRAEARLARQRALWDDTPRKTKGSRQRRRKAADKDAKIRAAAARKTALKAKRNARRAPALSREDLG